MFHYVTACVQLLLTHGAPVKVKNLAGWSPLAEAISYGDRITSSYEIIIIDLEITYFDKKYISYKKNS